MKHACVLGQGDPLKCKNVDRTAREGKTDRRSLAGESLASLYDGRFGIHSWIVFDEYRTARFIPIRS